MGRRCGLFGCSTALVWCYINHPGIASPAIEMLIQYRVNSNTDEYCEKFWEVREKSKSADWRRQKGQNRSRRQRRR